MAEVRVLPPPPKFLNRLPEGLRPPDLGMVSQDKAADIGLHVVDQAISRGDVIFDKIHSTLMLFLEKALGLLPQPPTGGK